MLFLFDGPTGVRRENRVLNFSQIVDIAVVRSHSTNGIFSHKTKIKLVTHHFLHIRVLPLKNENDFHRIHR